MTGIAFRGAAHPRVSLRDVQDLMAYPFFSLAKSKRLAPIDYRVGGISVRVEGTQEHGLATIWDADVLIWATSQLVEAHDAGLVTSKRLATTPYEILRYLDRGTSLRDYLRLKAALDRLQSTSVVTSLRQVTRRRMQRFSWISEWEERADGKGRPLGLELVLPDWLYAASEDPALVLRLDRGYFALTGGIERWLYRIARKHAGSQVAGWRFDLRHLHRKSGSLARFSDFTLQVRQLALRQSLPGYRIALECRRGRAPVLLLHPVPHLAHGVE